MFYRKEGYLLIIERGYVGPRAVCVPWRIYKLLNLPSMETGFARHTGRSLVTRLTELTRPFAYIEHWHDGTDKWVISCSYRVSFMKSPLFSFGYRVTE
jgi:hypothetical protein